MLICGLTLNLSVLLGPMLWPLSTSTSVIVAWSGRSSWAPITPSCLSHHQMPFAALLLVLAVAPLIPPAVLDGSGPPGRVLVQAVSTAYVTVCSSSLPFRPRSSQRLVRLSTMVQNVACVFPLALIPYTRYAPCVSVDTVIGCPALSMSRFTPCACAPTAPRVRTPINSALQARGRGGLRVIPGACPLRPLPPSPCFAFSSCVRASLCFCWPAWLNSSADARDMRVSGFRRAAACGARPAPALTVLDRLVGLGPVGLLAITGLIASKEGGPRD